jgi:GAF domain-containing protein
MASQLANAMENARLFQQSKEALEELETIQRRHIREGWEKYTRKH